ncbi:MAG TPA: EamA family transporter [Rubricoccaceae bacterium]|jgi:drug/metabolite transporter (DMT)-like permease
MGFLFLAVACSLGIATVFKLAERRDLDRTALLAVNYAAAAVLALVLQGAGGGDVAPGAVGLGVVQGVLFIGGFWLFSRAIREAGIGLAAGAMRLSVVVPVVVSWAVWGEAPSLVQGAGLVLAAVAFVLVARPAGGAPGGTVAGEAPAASAAADARSAPPVPRVGGALLLGLLFLSGGLVDVVMKAFQKGYSASVPTPTFLLFVFGVAFAVGAAAVVATGVRTGRWPGLDVVVWGVGLGVINYGSAEFLIRALGTLPAPVAFPLNSVSIVLGAALLGRVVWGERLSRANAAGLALAAVAVALLAG